MINLDMIQNARWDEIYLFLIGGEPPVLVLLLAVNTIFFMLFIVRRATQRHRMRTSTVYFVQAAVVLANGLVLFKEDAMRYATMLKGII